MRSDNSRGWSPLRRNPRFAFPSPSEPRSGGRNKKGHKGCKSINRDTVAPAGRGRNGAPLSTQGAVSMEPLSGGYASWASPPAMFHRSYGAFIRHAPRLYGLTYATRCVPTLPKPVDFTLIFLFLQTILSIIDSYLLI